MEGRSRNWVDIAIVAGLAALVIGGVLWPDSPKKVMIVDRPRPDGEPTDHLLDFLRTTQTPYTIEEGYVTLVGTPEVHKRLSQLLVSLHTHLQVLAENRRPVVADASRPYLTCRPRPDGTVDVVPQPPSIHQDLEEFERAAALEESLEAQYTAVLAALRALEPGTVGERDRTWRPGRVMQVLADPPAEPNYPTAEMDSTDLDLPTVPTAALRPRSESAPRGSMPARR